MTKEEFMTQVCMGLPKFIDQMHEYQEREELSYDLLDEADWWEQYTSWVELNGINP